MDTQPPSPLSSGDPITAKPVWNMMLLVAYEQCCDMVLKLIKCDFSFALLWSGTFHTSLINLQEQMHPQNIQVTRGSFPLSFKCKYRCKYSEKCTVIKIPRRGEQGWGTRGLFLPSPHSHILTGLYHLKGNFHPNLQT